MAGKICESCGKERKRIIEYGGKEICNYCLEEAVERRRQESAGKSPQSYWGE